MSPMADDLFAIRSELQALLPLAQGRGDYELESMEITTIHNSKGVIT